MSEPSPLPCPFCGGVADAEKDREADQWRVVCRQCGGQMGNPATLDGYTHSEGAIENWNKRR